MSAPMQPRRRRLRIADTALAVVALLLIVATAKTVADQTALRDRIPTDTRAFTAFVTARHVADAFRTPDRVRTRGDFDIMCAHHETAGRPDYRLCLELLRYGPVRRRIVGGYRLPLHLSRGHRSAHACFGIAAVQRLCAPESPGWRPVGA